MFKSIFSFILLLLVLGYETANATESILLTVQTAEDLSNQDGADVTQDCGRKKDKSWLGTNLDITHSYLGLRFHGPSLPPFSQITSAQLYVTNNFSANQKGSLDLEIRAEKSISPEGFWCDIITAPSERLTTESYSNYHSTDNWLKNEQLELDVSAPIQELAAENALSSSIALIIKGIGKKHERKFIYNLQKKNVALETLPYLIINYDIIPPPSNAEALRTFLENLAGFEQFEISAEGIISVIINGQTHRGQLGEITSGTPPSDRQLQLIEIADVNGDGITDYQFIYPSGDRQTAYYFGIVPAGPPDPAEVANPIDPTVASLFDINVAFLYSGDNPIQTGVAPGTIDPLRVAVIRGQVLTREGEPLSGVQLTVLHHQEYGQTLSRMDGKFDLAVNGGSDLTINYHKAGYLPVQRTIHTIWNDYALLDEVVMIPPDSQVSHIDLTAGVMQIAQSTEITDEDGTRRAILLFPAGTISELIQADGTRQPLTKLDVRATEYTVGPRGPQTMPAELPPTTSYTYAVEFSADQANNQLIEFNPAIPVYIDNFINIPVGEIVPSGYYDPQQAAWIASKNGRVIKLLSINEGIATLDITGNGTPANIEELTTLGITPDEQQQLATLYPVGKSLWRIPVDHFSIYDFNWLGILPPETTAPPLTLPNNQQPTDTPDCQTGSLIHCQNQILGEQLPVAGTPFTLNYTTERVTGRTAERTLTIPLSFDTHPKFIKTLIEIEIAGRRFKESVFPGQTHYHFTWDGKDIYGRTLYGKQRARLRLGYEYQPVYVRSNLGEGSFAKGSGGAFIADGRQALELAHWSGWLTTSLGNLWDNRSQGLGGWSLNNHHVYNPTSKDLLLGNGQKRGHSPILGGAITAVNQNNKGTQLTVGAEGSIYFFVNSSLQTQISRLNRDGSVEIIAGTGTDGYSYSPTENVPATTEKLGRISDLKIGKDNNIYLAESRSDGNRVRRITNGWITTIAGGGPTHYKEVATHPELRFRATDLKFPSISGLAIANQEIYLGLNDGNETYVYQIEANNIVSVKADIGYRPGAGHSLRGLETGPDGSLMYLYMRHGYSISSHNLIYLRPQTPVGQYPAHPINQILANLATQEGYRYVSLSSFTIDSAGILYVICNYFNQAGETPTYAGERLIRLGSDNLPTVIAGGTGNNPLDGYGDNSAATSARLNATDIAIAPDNTLYLADRQRIRKIAPALPGVGLEDMSIAAEDGTAIYQFTREGKHLRTLDATLGTTLHQFNYNANGYLNEIIDQDGDVTHIERDNNSLPLAIISADGQRTELTLNEQGYLTRLENPAGESYRINYTEEGLITEFTTPRGHSSSFNYDHLGRLIRDQNAAGGFWELMRLEPDNDTYQVSMSSALGRTTIYEVINSSNQERRTNIYPDGTQRQETTLSNGIVTKIQADGTKITQKLGADPRFGVVAPLTESLKIQLPSGLTAILQEQRAVTLNPESDLSRPLSATNRLIINGKTTQSVYQAATKTITTTSPVGRQTTALLSDDLKHIIRQSVSGIEPVNYNYDTRGRLTQVSTGTEIDLRTATIVYDAKGNIQSITDALNRQVSFTYDAVGRVLSQTLTDGRIVHYQYDANGNVTSITPPSRPEHLFEYDVIDYPIEYQPPLLPTVTQPQTQYVWNLDKQLTQIIRPDGQTINFNYDEEKGRLGSITLPNGTQTIAYDDKGRIANITAIDGNTLSYGYDGSLPLSENWSGTVNGSLQLTYNIDFQVSSASVNGNSVNYQYDNDGLLTKAGDILLSRDVQNGLLTGTILGNLATQRSYSNFGELQEEIASFDNTSLYQTHYERDKVGRITQKVETVNGITNTFEYRYDLAGRLVEVKQNGIITESYQYDENGNRLNQNAIYDDQDRLLQYGLNYYTYTANGELLTKNETTYHYDVLGNLKQVQLPDKTIDYVIDARNRRIGKKVDGQLVQGFLYQGSLKLIAELDGNGQIVARFVYGSKANIPDYILKDGKKYRIVSDHLGSPRLVVDIVDSAVIQRMDYDAFGNVLLDTNPGFQPFGFAGGLYDLDTKLVRFGARDYDSEVGRWASKDPIGFAGQDSNLFSYVFSDPVNWIDLDGREAGAMTIGEVSSATSWIETIAKATQRAIASVSIGTGAAVVTGIGLALWPTPVGEGSDIVPIPKPMEMAKGGIQSKENEWSLEARQQPDPCKWLREQYDSASCSATRMKIKTAQKVLGCRKNSSTK